MNEQETDVLSILQRMQQQLTYLEKKIDTLIQKSEQKPAFNRDRNFSRPFRPFGRSNRPEGRGNDFNRGSRPEGGYNQDRPERNGNFAPKKHHFGRRKDRD